MQWFTRHWADGALSSDEMATRELDYLHHLESLPAHQQTAARMLALRDSTIQSWGYQTDPGLLVLAALAQAGDSYELFDLRFDGAALDQSASDLQAWRITGPDARIAAIEFDSMDSANVVRLLLRPSGEITVVYNELVIRSAPASAGGTVAAIDA